MHLKDYRRWTIILVAALVSAGCGGGAAAPTPTPSRVTVHPAGDFTFVPGCDTADLENWVESADFLIPEFMRTAGNLGSEPAPEAIRPGVERLMVLRDGLVAIPVPEGCAAEVQTLTIEMMESVLRAYEAYANGQAVDLEAVLSEVNAVFGDISTLQSDLLQRLREQFRAGQAEN